MLSIASSLTDVAKTSAKTIAKTITKTTKATNEARAAKSSSIENKIILERLEDEAKSIDETTSNEAKKSIEAIKSTKTTTR